MRGKQTLWLHPIDVEREKEMKNILFKVFECQNKKF